MKIVSRSPWKVQVSWVWVGADGFCENGPGAPAAQLGPFRVPPLAVGLVNLLEYRVSGAVRMFQVAIVFGSPLPP
jgi:hypothetical protein